MKIVVNTRLLIKGKLEGIGWFSYETLKRITKSHPEHHFFFLFDRVFDESFIFSDNITPVVLSPQARHPILFKIWFNWSVHRYLKKIKADVFLSPDGYLSLTTNVPQLAVIHDLNFEHYPEFLPRHITRYYKRNFPLFAQKAAKIVTVSNFSKQDIVNQYGIDDEKINVAYNGVNELFEPISKEKKELIKVKYTKGHPYFIYVGSLNPRKNIENMLKAFDEFKKQTKLKHKFLIVGEKLWSSKSIEICYNQLDFKEDILFVGRLFNTDLREVLATATALLYVSFFEGFGIPVVEAMKCGTPVITSNNTSLPEVAGDAALFCNPKDYKGIANVMLSVTNKDVSRLMVKRGLKQAEKFNWDKTALEVWEAIEEILKKSRQG